MFVKKKKRLYIFLFHFVFSEVGCSGAMGTLIWQLYSYFQERYIGMVRRGNNQPDSYLIFSLADVSQRLLNSGSTRLTASMTYIHISDFL